jgi:hypothetical protein
MLNASVNGIQVILKKLWGVHSVNNKDTGTEWD